MSSCGEIQNISYPFRLKTDPTNCGDLGYELSCVNNKTILRFQEGNYFIKKINYTVNLIRVVDIKFANVNRSCNLPSGHIQSESELDVDFYYHGTVNHSYVAFLNCSENITLPNFIRVPCFSRNDSFVYAMHYDSYLNEKINNLSCKTISVTPVDNIEDDQKPASYDDVLMLLRSGFDLRWSVECRDCTLVGQGCVIPSSEKPWVYKCEKHHCKIACLGYIYGKMMRCNTLWHQIVSYTII